MNACEGAQPLVSVIIPSFNHGLYITSCVESVLNQDYPCIEIIVIDDGSTDNSIELLEKYGDRIVLIQQVGGRQAKARNLGLNRAKGEYIAFLDSDDRYLPGRIKSAMDVFLREPDVDVVWGNYRLVDADDRIIAEVCWQPEMEDFRFELVSGNPICNSTVTVRRKLLDEIGGFDERIPRACDGLAWYLIAARNGRFVHLDDFILEYRLHGANDSNGFAKMTVERDTALLTAVHAYIEDAVVTGDKYYWLRNAVAKQFAFNSAAYVQSRIHSDPFRSVKTALFKALGSSFALNILARIRALKPGRSL